MLGLETFLIFIILNNASYILVLLVGQQYIKDFLNGY
jgi:hypothetical protein